MLCTSSIRCETLCKGYDNYGKATTIPKIFETKSSFHVKQRSTRKVQFLFFSSFLLVLTKYSFWEEDWALGYNSMKFGDFSDISKFPKILSLRSFGNL